MEDRTNQIDPSYENDASLLAEILSSAKDAIILIDDEGLVRLWSGAAEELFGFTAGEVMGKELHPVIVPGEYLGEYRDNFERFRGTGRGNAVGKTLELRGRRKSGEDVTVELSLNSLKIDGRWHAIGVVRDITERKNLERRMRDSLEFTERIIANSPLGIATYKSTGRCMTANESFVDMIGAPGMDAVLGQNFHDIPSWKSSGLYVLAMDALSSDGLKRGVVEIRTTFGREAWLSCSLIPFGMKEERHLILMVDDITPIKRSELAARDGMKFVNSLIDTFPSPIYYKDLDGRYLGCNAAFEQFVGKPKMKIIGRTVFDVSAPELAPLYHEKDGELLADPPKQVYEAMVRDAGGKELVMQFHKAVFTAGGDVTAGIIGVMIDVTERKKTEEMFRELSLIDALTGLGNRRNFNDMLAAEWRRTCRAGGSLALLLIDIDHFKSYNDTYGHQAGDACLAAVAAAIKGAAGRAGDFCARYGGEEFTVLLPDTPVAGAAVVGERIRTAVMGLAVPHAASEPWGCVSVSIGAAAAAPSGGMEAADLVTMADAALYCAKERGRNRVET